MTIIDLSRFEKFKESQNYVVYLEKDRKGKSSFDMCIHYKGSDKYWRVPLSDALFKLFFEPEEYKKVYMQDRGKGSR